MDRHNRQQAPIYLDWNATTPLHPEVALVMQRAQQSCWGNPSSVHGIGRQARAMLEQARETLSAVLGLHPRDVFFTSGGTEANNLALRAAPAVVTSRLEHPSVVRVAEALAEAGRPVRWLSVAASGRIEPEAVDEALLGLPAGTLVAVMAANHETGVIQPVNDIAERVHARGARLHVDAVQALGKLDPELWRLADSVAVAAHKIRGPKGIGALGCQPNQLPRPVLYGGAQERGLRPGTLDAVLAAGFEAALQCANSDRQRALLPLRDQLEQALSESAEINGDVNSRLHHVSNLSFAGWRGDELVAALDLMGVCVASGSACSAGTTEASPVITAMLGSERAKSAVRISLGEATTAEHVKQAILAFKRVIGRRQDDFSRDG